MKLFRPSLPSLRALRIWLTLLFLPLAYLITAKAHGEVSIHWMYQYNFREFSDWDKAWDFFSVLRTGISPFWAFIDIACFRLFGNLHLPEHYIFQASMIISFLLPMWLFAYKRWQLIFMFFAGWVSLNTLMYLHKGNPQVYDMYLPAMLLLFIKCLQLLSKPNMKPWLRVILVVFAGFLLSATELTRPYVTALLPFLIWGGFVALRSFSRKYFLLFLLPVLLMSGGWHAKLLIQHGQLSWTNHTGFNLWRCWHPIVGYIDEENEPPRYEGGMSHINTEKHYQRSKFFSQEIFKAIKKRPLKAMQHLSRRFFFFWGPQVELYHVKEWRDYYFPYSLAVWFTGICMYLSMWQLARRIWRNGLNGLAGWLGRPEIVLLICTFLTTCIYIALEGGEDARFMLSTIPLLISLPGFQHVLEARKTAD